MSNAARHARTWAEIAEANIAVSCSGGGDCGPSECQHTRSIDLSIRMAAMWSQVAQAEALNNTEEFDGTEELFGGEPPLFS